MPSTPFYRGADLRRIEAAAREQVLMQRAGRAAADLAATLAAGGAPLLFLAGPGNNGGDAFEAARLLRRQGHALQLVFAGDAERLPADAAAAYRRYVDEGGQTLAAIPDAPRWSLIVDGLFGIGLTRALAEPYSGIVAQANALAARDACPLLALDCPSGLDAERGTTLGATIRATHTISFIGGKPGLYTADGPDHCGAIVLDTLGLDRELLAPEAGRTVGADLFADQLKPRARNSHKGSFGSAGIVGGAPGMVGAALLAARAALRLGSGRVYLGLLDARAPAFDVQQPELMLRSPRQVIAGEISALACGPGLGRSADAADLLAEACALPLPLLLDADALNALAQTPGLAERLAARAAPTLLTPHPAEAARLLCGNVAGVQSDRLGAACEIAARYRAWVALKGCGTIVAAPDGALFINTSGNPALATAGSGDVLSGIACALLAQHWPARDALLAAVHLHGAAADRLVAQGIGPVGLAAGELIDGARACLNDWIASANRR